MNLAAFQAMRTGGIRFVLECGVQMNPRNRIKLRAIRVALAVVVTGGINPISAYAHHEALFGPQASAALSPSIFISTQVFDIERGHGDNRTHATTTVLSAGVQPVKRVPLSMSFVVPFSVEQHVGEPTRRAMEDSLVSARYKWDTEAITKDLGLDESYVMGVGGVELPTGTMDHPFGKGRAGGIAAVMLSVEKRPVAGIVYSYIHRAPSWEGSHTSNNVFTGAGLAFTPVDDEEHGKLLSFQLGASYEETSRETEAGAPVNLSGGTGVFMHPSLVFDIGTHIQIFNLVSLPVTQNWRDVNDRQRFRFGSGAIFKL